MKKYIFIALIAVVCLFSTSLVLAKELVTGYDVNNDCKAVKVEKGVYAPGVSLYLSECKNPMIGVTTKSNLSVTGNATISGTASVGTFTQGGGIRSTSTLNSTATLLASDFDVENYVDYTPNKQGGVTLTLPASTTLASFAPVAGKSRVVYIKNATSTANTPITLSAGTDETFMIASGTATAVIKAGKMGRLEFIRKAATTTTFGFTILVSIFDN